MTTLAQISETQAQKATTANENFDALAYAGLFGRRAAGISGLTWAYYGGILYVAGVATAIADGTVALTLNLTNYVEATTAGVVSANTVGFTAGRMPLYTVVCGATTISSYADQRSRNLVGDFTVKGNMTVGGTLAVTGAATFSSSLTVTDATRTLKVQARTADAGGLRNGYDLVVNSAHVLNIAGDLGGGTTAGGVGIVFFAASAGIWYEALKLRNVAGGATTGLLSLMPDGGGVTMGGTLGVTGTLTGAAANFSGTVTTGLFAATTASGPAIYAKHTSGDMFRISPGATNSGVVFDSVNLAETDYQPIGFYGNGITINSRNGAGTTAQVASFTSGATSLTGTLAVSSTANITGQVTLGGGSVISAQHKAYTGSYSTGSIANAATATIATQAGLGGAAGALVLLRETQATGSWALFAMSTDGGASALIGSGGPTDTYSAAAGTAGKCNVYQSVTAGNHIELQNNTGGARTYSVALLVAL